jgi:putative ABC transport system ATP-binding protein
MTNPIICVDNVHKSYLMGKEAVPALRGVSLDIDQGDFVCLMEPSGSAQTAVVTLKAYPDDPIPAKVARVGFQAGAAIGDARPPSPSS